MVDNNLLRKAKFDKKELNSNSKNDLIGFVTAQFRELVRKNLKMPVKLYQL